MRRRTPLLSRLTFLLLASCGAPSGSDDSAADLRADGVAPPGAVPRGWSQAFTAVEGGGYLAQPTDRALIGHFSETGPRLEHEGELFSVRLRAWGRNDATRAVPDVAPRLGGCLPLGAEGECVEPLEYVSPGLVEWWVAAEHGLEQGWTIAAPPPGAGDVVLAVGIDADLEWVDGEPLIVGARGQVAVTALAAWDADGAALDASFEATPEGFAIRVDDADARYPITVDPVYTTAPTTLDLFTASSSSRAPQGIVPLGDTNGDGYDDFAITETTYTYVYNGGATSSSWDSYATYIALGSTSLGTAVDGGDLNNDGYGDLVMGDQGYSTSKGRIYAYYGSASGITSSGATGVLSTTASERFGSGIAVADVNNDGYDDTVVGARGYSSSKGRLLIYNGSAAGLPATATATINGTGVSQALGSVLAYGGDVNGDGYEDILAGEPSYGANAGRAVVYLGSATGLSSSSTVTFTGGSVGDNLGASVASAGDVNNDGYDDILIGAYGYGSSNGRAYVYHGSSTGLGSSAATTLSGTGAEELGFSVAGAGDVDGDGYDDVIVGSLSYDDPWGGARVYLGGSSGVATTAVSTIESPSNVVSYGIRVGGVGDVDNDGFDDVVVAGAKYGSSSPYALYPVAYSYLGYIDADGDGYSSITDCDEADAAINPGAIELVGDNVDQNCNGSETCYTDTDADAYRSSATVSSADTDCDDAGEALATDTSGDCDDTNAAINPIAAEGVGDNVDSNCNGSETCYVDADNDNNRLSTTIVSADTDCRDSGEGLATDPDADCNDAVATIYVGATETVGDQIDQSCDGAESCYADDDDDGYRMTTAVASADTDCTDPGEAVTADPTGDCDDTNPAAYTGAPELTGTGVDEDCDTHEVCYADADLDTYGTYATSYSADADCDDPGESTSGGTDCDDTNGSIHPGAAETPADGVDGDCDGVEACYADADADGYRTATTIVSADRDCTDAGEAGTAVTPGDCDDGNALVSPAATEVVADGTDNDCDGNEACYVDADGDGYRLSTTVASEDDDCSDPGEAASAAPASDCDDSTASVSPGAPEGVGDNVDSDCDGGEVCYANTDGDAYRVDTTLVSADADCADAGEAASALTSGDCDDAVATTYPGATEAVGDDVDSDCDGGEVCYVDADGDSWRIDTTVASTDTDCADAGEARATADAGDCDDTNPAANPDVTEVVDDGVDGDCDGGERCYADTDLDGYRDAVATVASTDLACDADGEATSADAIDCDDVDGAVFPGAAELAGDEVDGDCDGRETCYADADSDGARGTSTVASSDLSCEGPGEAGLTAAEDCDETDAAISPTATELPADGVDQNCDGREDCYIDADGDGFRIVATLPSEDADCTDAGEAGADVPSPDCDDSDPATNPGARDTPDDAIDQNCDGADGTLTAGDDTGTGGGGGEGCGCSPTGGVPQGAAFVFVFAGLLAARRRGV